MEFAGEVWAVGWEAHGGLNYVQIETGDGMRREFWLSQPIERDAIKPGEWLLIRAGRYAGDGLYAKQYTDACVVR